MKYILILTFLTLLTSCSPTIRYNSKTINNSFDLDIDRQILIEDSINNIVYYNEVNLIANVLREDSSKLVIKDTMGLDSMVLFFFGNGQVYAKIPYKHGKQHGLKTIYHSNGQLYNQNIIVNGSISDGYTYYYDVNGFILEEGYYKNGKPVGFHLFYVNGIPFKKRKYVKGKCTKVFEFNRKLKSWKKIKS